MCDAFVFVTAAFEQAARGRVFGQTARFDPAQVQFDKGVMHQRINRFAHVAVARIALADPIACGASLGRAATDIVERDRPEERLILTANEEQRNGSAISERPLGPIHTVGKGLAAQVVLGPFRFPRGQELTTLLPKVRPLAPVAMIWQPQCHAVCFQPDLATPPQHYATSLDFRVSRSGAFWPGP